ncbi:hypothetical protein E1A91_D03G120300v1 [Gossypium mustelinum]|uniref:Uncharacterized protein n=1 Tax=Gossypium mustelinum TaxID=34275 RepID=A0A5D2VM27_GOSMU|nr:hypothetical protein E1A91_D03G120300v1 [Gossypium mustelinum]
MTVLPLVPHHELFNFFFIPTLLHNSIISSPLHSPSVLYHQHFHSHRGLFYLVPNRFKPLAFLSQSMCCDVCFSGILPGPSGSAL